MTTLDLDIFVVIAGLCTLYAGWKFADWWPK